MRKNISFRVTFKGSTHSFSVPAYGSNDKKLWGRTCVAIDKAFSFSDDFEYVVYQSYKDKRGDSLVGTKDNNDSLEITLQWWKDGSGTIPLRLAEQDKETYKDVDIKIGVHPLYHLVSFPNASPPSLKTVSAEAMKLDLLAARLENGAKQLHLLDEDGTFVKITDDAVWKRVGWRRALKVFDEALKENDWSAATFHVGPLCPRSLSRGSPATQSILSSPPYEVVEILKDALDQV
ncbi:hypothetical protein JCM11641_007317 [Rhodosporidiobolus odoratus]